MLLCGLSCADYFNGLDSSAGRASDFEAGGRGFESHGRTIYHKCKKNGTSSSLAGARIKRVVLGRQSKAGKYLLKNLLCRRIARELMLFVTL